MPFLYVKGWSLEKSQRIGRWTRKWLDRLAVIIIVLFFVNLWLTASHVSRLNAKIRKLEQSCKVKP